MINHRHIHLLFDKGINKPNSSYRIQGTAIYTKQGKKIAWMDYSDNTFIELTNNPEDVVNEINADIEALLS